MTELTEIEKEIEIVSKFISERICNIKLSYQIKNGELQRKGDNLIIRLQEVIYTMEKNIKSLQKDEFGHIKILIAEANLEGFKLALKIVEENFK